jgi:hypothetical protein
MSESRIPNSLLLSYALRSGPKLIPYTLCAPIHHSGYYFSFFYPNPQPLLLLMEMAQFFQYDTLDSPLPSTMTPDDIAIEAWDLLPSELDEADQLVTSAFATKPPLPT